MVTQSLHGPIKIKLGSMLLKEFDEWWRS